MSKIALDIKKLKKIYGDGFEALKGIDLQVKEGDFFALLGPNGAGKSTTIGIISSLVNKSSGSVKIFEHDLDTDSETAKTYLGLVPQEFNMNVFENIIDVLIYQAGYYGLSRKEAAKNAEFYLKKLGLWEKRNNAVRFLSGGMKRRLMIARGLIHNPKLLILDEPTAGVDIELRRGMWDFLREINLAGVTIILTTHYLEEAEALCRNVAIINHGKIVENTSVKSLISKLQSETVILELDGNYDTIPDLENYRINIIDSSTIEVGFCKTEDLNTLFEHLSKHNIIVTSLRNKGNKLEEIFVNLTSK